MVGRTIGELARDTGVNVKTIRYVRGAGPDRTLPAAHTWPAALWRRGPALRRGEPNARGQPRPTNPNRWPATLRI